MNRNTSALIVEKNSEIGKLILKVHEDWKSKPIHLSKMEKSWQHIMAYTKKIIIVDGEKYDVIKARYGYPTKNGHIQFFLDETIG